jgi:hypothetical protein
MFVLAPRHEERTSPMHRMQTAEIDIAAIHDIDGARLRVQHIEDVDIGHFAVRNMQEARDISAQIQQRMHLHRRLGRPEVRPGKDRQAQVDGRRIQRVDRVGQFQAKVFPGVELPSLNDQSPSQFRIDPPIPGLIGIRQRRTQVRAASADAVWRSLCMASKSINAIGWTVCCQCPPYPTIVGDPAACRFG